MTMDTTVVRVTTSQDPSMMPLAEPDCLLHGEAAHSDLMDALTQSLAQRAALAATPGTPAAPMPKKPPVKVGTRGPAAIPGRAHASKK